MSTTRRLYLLRHAQACPGGPSDHARPLDGQDEADARALGRLMMSRSITPSRVIASDSARTRGTWACLEMSGLRSKVAFEPRLYNGSEHAYRSIVGEAEPVDLMLIGHNPTIASLAGALAIDGEASAMDRLGRGFPTCTLAVLRFDGGSEHGHLEAMLSPPHPVR